MNITFEELRAIKHKMPKGSISKLSQMLGLPEQTIRNYFGAKDYQSGAITDLHRQSGPKGGIVHLEDTTILEAAKGLIAQASI